MKKLKLSIAILSVIMVGCLYGRFVQTDVRVTECVKCENGVSYFVILDEIKQVEKECTVGNTYKVYMFNFEDCNPSNDVITKVVEVK